MKDKLLFSIFQCSKTGCDSRFLLVLFVIGLLLLCCICIFVALCVLDGTNISCYDVEAPHAVVQHEHSLDQFDHAFDHQEHSLEPARA